MGIDSIDRSSIKRLYSQMLFDPFEEQLDLPAEFVKLTDCQCIQLKMVGNKHESSVLFFVSKADSPQWYQLIFGERHLEYLIKEYVAHYHAERAHQGLDNNLIEPPPQGEGEIICYHRIGGLLKFYRRAA